MVDPADVRFVRAALACAVLVPSHPARANGALGISADIDFSQLEDVEQLSLEDLLDRPVTAASGFAEKPSDSPTIVTTIEADEIQRFGYRTLADTLRGTRGIYTINDRNYSYIGARGVGMPGDYNTRFALSIDDHLLNDPVYTQASIGLELGVPMIAIDRVELVRGGSWLVHGSNALLGAIQVTTATGASRPGLHVTSTTRATAETSSDPANRDSVASRGEDVAASYGTVTERGVDVFVAGSYTYDPGLQAIYFPELDGLDEPCVDSRKRLVPRCTGVVTGADAEELGNAYGSISYKGLTLHLLAARRLKETPAATFGARIGDPLSTIDDRVWANLRYRRSTENFDVAARVAADYYRYRGFYTYAIDPADNSGEPALPSADETTAPIIAGELRTRYRHGDLGDHIENVEVGLVAEAMTTKAYQWGGDSMADGTIVPWLDHTDRATRLALGSHVAGRMFDHVVGFAALRADYDPHAEQLALDPQLGLVLDGAHHGRVRASWSRGHRSPNLYERINKVGPTLRPEHSDTHELSYERFIGKNVHFLLVGFHQDIRELITVSATDDAQVFANEGRIHLYGMESELEARWSELLVRASLTLNHARTDNGMQPPNSPHQIANIAVLAPLGKRAEGGVQGYFVGERASADGTMLPAMFTTNVVFTLRDVIQNLDLTAGVANVFDERGGDPGSEDHRMSRIPRDPRTVWLRLAVRLDQ